MCNNSCCECPRKIFSTSVGVVTIDDVNTLVIGIPEQTFNNCHRGCIVIIQNIPTTATINTPVVINIGGGTETYPAVDKYGNPITVCSLRTRVRYPFIVNTANGGIFKILRNLSCAPNNNSSTIPATT